MFERIRVHRAKVEEFLGSLVQRAGGDPMMNHADRQDGDEPTVLREAAEIVEAAVGLICAVCEDPIEPGSDYVQAAYGPVHSEPCSHQGKVD